MRLAISFALFLAATTGAPRQGCGGVGTATTPPAYDACAGKACGETCTACAPGDRDCAETMVVKACDPAHRARPGRADLALRELPREHDRRARCRRPPAAARAI